MPLNIFCKLYLSWEPEFLETLQILVDFHLEKSYNTSPITEPLKYLKKHFKKAKDVLKRYPPKNNDIQHDIQLIFLFKI